MFGRTLLRASGFMATLARAAALLGLSCAGLHQAHAVSPSACTKPVYLTFDTGHMGVAPLVAEVLRRHAVPVTFFLANERTRTGGSSLDETWAPWWRDRAAEGHLFASHTWDHWVLQPGQEGNREGPWRFRVTQGARAGQLATEGAARYCEQLREPVRRFREMTGQPMAALFRAPGGRVSPGLLEAAQACGFQHVGWAPAGFLGDELDSDRHPNEALLRKALRDIRAGDVLVAHLGIWSRQDPWAPAVLEPLIEGLKARGFCFLTLRDHPRHADAAARVAPSGPVSGPMSGPVSGPVR